ncbi:MAG TPA: zinc finger domain-containing protein, partial [Gemmatimonadaceae bacterium]
FRWRAPGGKAVPKSLILAEMQFATGVLTLTEAGTTRRAAMHVVRPDGLAALDRGGVEPLGIPFDTFRERLQRENRTIKRALTDPRILAGIGNAYSDEILHRARLSPLALSTRLDDDEVRRLHEAARATLAEWTRKLRDEAGDGFPEQVTAFREGMAVHGRHGQPCPVCGAPVQRIRYATNETNYCARCQTEGRRLADRALSRLLREDWPRSIDEVE